MDRMGRSEFRQEFEKAEKYRREHGDVGNQLEVDWDTVESVAEFPFVAVKETIFAFIGVNTANAPGPGDKTYPSLTNWEHAKNIVINAVEGKVVKWVGGKLLGGTGPSAGASAGRALRGSQFSACVGGPGPCVPNAVNSIRSTLGLDRVAMRQAAVTTSESAELATVAARMDAVNLATSAGGLRLSSGLTRLAQDGRRLVDADYFVITQSGQHAVHLTVRNGAGIIVDGANRLPLRADSFPSGTLFYRVLGAE
jgi:hypothetical protein